MTRLMSLALRLSVMVLALYGALDLARTAMAQDEDHLYLPYSRQPGDADLAARVERLEALLAGLSRDGDELTLSGANLRIVSGSGRTDGPPNGRGNLIVGYNESRGGVNPDGTPVDLRGGSHMLVVGKALNFSRFGGLVVGSYNDATGEWASVLGGSLNSASGTGAIVIGGAQNSAGGTGSVAVGGGESTVTGWRASAFGGERNEAHADGSVALGGHENVIASEAEWGTITGGKSNELSGQASSIGGGSGVQLDAVHAWAAAALRSP
jgi:hypothetical protein